MIATALTLSPGVAPSPAPTLAEEGGDAFASLLGALQAALPVPEIVPEIVYGASPLPIASTPLEFDGLGVSAPMPAALPAAVPFASAIAVVPPDKGEGEVPRPPELAEQNPLETNIAQPQFPAVAGLVARLPSAPGAPALLPSTYTHALSAPVAASKPRALAAPVPMSAPDAALADAAQTDATPTDALPAARQPVEARGADAAESASAAQSSTPLDTTPIVAASPSPVATLPRQIGNEANKSPDRARTGSGRRGAMSFVKMPSAKMPFVASVARGDPPPPDRSTGQVSPTPLLPAEADRAILPAVGVPVQIDVPVAASTPVTTTTPVAATTPVTNTTPVTAAPLVQVPPAVMTAIASPFVPLMRSRDDVTSLATDAVVGPKRNTARRAMPSEPASPRPPVIAGPAESPVAAPPGSPHSPVSPVLIAASAPLADPAPVMIAPPTSAATAPPNAQPLTTAQPSLGGALLAYRLEGAFAAGDVPRDWAQAFDAGGAARVEARTSSLGSVAIEVARANDGVAITLGASTPDARVMLAEAQPRLAADARAAGVALTQSRVDDAPQGDRRGNARGRQPPRHHTPNSVAAPTASAADRYA